jgi:hypothetical protein
MKILKYSGHAALVAGLSFWGIGTSHAQINLNAGSASYSQNFNTLDSAGAQTDIAFLNNSTITGFYAAKQQGAGFPTVAAYRSSQGGSNSGQLYSFGQTGNSDRAFGSISSGTPGTFNYGFQLVNTDASDLTSLAVSYTGEQWRTGGAVTAAQELTFEYQVFPAGTGSINAASGWTTVNPLSFVVTDTGTATAAAGVTSPISTQALSGTVTATVSNGSELWIRWTDINNPGNDHGLGLDDLLLTATFGAAVPEPGSLALLGLAALPGAALLRRRKLAK